MEKDLLILLQAIVVAVVLIRFARLLSLESMSVIEKTVPFSILKRFSYALLFLPGTFLHELSHFLTAKLLFVPVYGFSIYPRRSSSGITLGQVTIEKTDIIRETLVGFAPAFLGIGLLAVIGKYFPLNSNKITTAFITIYMILQISNMLLLSKSDKRSLVKCIFILSIVASVIFFLSRQQFYFLFSLIFSNSMLVASKLTPYLVLALAVNFALYGILVLMKKLVNPLTNSL